MLEGRDTSQKKDTWLIGKIKKGMAAFIRILWGGDYRSSTGLSVADWRTC